MVQHQEQPQSIRDLGQERSEEEGCLTTLTMWRSHGCYLRCSPARNKSMDSACRARIRSGFAARDSCPNLLSTYFLLDIAYIAALFLLKIHNLQNTMPLYEDGCQKKETNPGILASGSKVRIPSGIVRALVGFQLELGH